MDLPFLTCECCRSDSTVPFAGQSFGDEGHLGRIQLWENKVMSSAYHQMARLEVDQNYGTPPASDKPNNPEGQSRRRLRETVS
jgi:hypothetical protein